MKILIIGGGGREHAIVWALKRSAHRHELHVTPGNAGISRIASCHAIPSDRIDDLCQFARNLRPDLIVIGPEAPLTMGLVDRLGDCRIFGPSERAARLEGSKVYAKEFMARHGIPTARWRICRSLEEAGNAIRQFNGACVIKADGLAAGKGVVVCSGEEEADSAARMMLVDKRFGDAGATILVEEKLVGEEASIMAVSDGESWCLLETSQDHKAVGEGDTGANTGGMGSYSPAPVITPPLKHTIEEQIIRPTILGMRRDGSPFIGILYVGIMVVDSHPYVLEYNVRFGDPETQSVLMRLKSDLCDVILAAVNGTIAALPPLVWDPSPSVCVVAASGGYPGAYRSGYPIIDASWDAAETGVEVFHAGTASDSDGGIRTAGGRVLAVCALGDTFRRARDRAYARLKKIQFEGIYYRNDIGWRALDREVGK